MVHKRAAYTSEQSTFNNLFISILNCNTTTQKILFTTTIIKISR